MKEKTTKRNSKKISWENLEIALATDVVSRAKRESRKWFILWVLTAVLLVISNVLWYVAYIM